MEAVLNELVSVEDLKNFERKFQSEQAAGSVSKSTQFEYAWCLVRSKYNDDIRKGIMLLEGKALGPLTSPLQDPFQHGTLTHSSPSNHQ